MNTQSKSKNLPDRLIFLVLLLLLIEYLAAFRQFGLNFQSFEFRDSFGYINSGLCFADSGIITMYDAPHPSAFVMPLYPVLIAFLSRFTGAGISLWVAVRFSSILFSIITAYIVYKSMRIFDENGWVSLLTVLPCFCPNIASINNFVMTEPLFRLLLSLCIYYTFRMGKQLSPVNVVMFSIFFTFALMVRANVLPLALFSCVYVIYCNWDTLQSQNNLKLFIPAILIVLSFVVPWTIRNYRYFHAFIPLTYGEGDPMLASSSLWPNYSGPTDMTISEESEQKFHDLYAAYYDDSENLVYPHTEQYLTSRKQLIEASNRFKHWTAENSWIVPLKYYLFTKPLSLINWVYYPTSVFDADYEIVHAFARVNIILCGLGILLSVFLKKYIPEILFLTGSYAGFLLLISTSYAIDRYTFPFAVFRYLIAGFSLLLVRDIILRIQNNLRNKKTDGFPSDVS